jgi:hypothetical protein
VRFTYPEAGGQTATVRRLERAQAAGTGEGGQVIVEGAPVSMAREAQVTEAAARLDGFLSEDAPHGARRS